MRQRTISFEGIENIPEKLARKCLSSGLDNAATQSQEPEQQQQHQGNN